MKNILVTGAGGYIGRHVIHTLLEMGYAVTAADIRPAEVDERADFRTIDIFSEHPGLFQELGSPDILIHLAWKDGFVHNSPAHLEYLPKHYQFLKSMVDSGCKNISVMGTMHEIGYFDGEINEHTPTAPSSLYAISKNALRQSLETLARVTPFSLRWLRGFYILGDDSHNNSIFTKLLQAAANGAKEFPFTTGTNQYDFIDVDDLALEIALASVQNEESGIINCCSGKPVALKDQVEGFISDHSLSIQLKYGVYPDRPYDSKLIYGNNQKIKAILTRAKEQYGASTESRIARLLSRMA